VAETESADGRTGSADVLPVGSGTYRVQFSRTGGGIYAATVRERPNGAEQRLVAREHQIFVPLEELMQRPADTSSLAAMAEAAEGKVISGPREILAVAPEGGFRAVRPYNGLLWTGVIGLFLFIGSRRFPSIWRRRVDEQRRRKQEEDRVLTARAAYERVRKTLDERNKPVLIGRSDRYSSPPPAPSAPALSPPNGPAYTPPPPPAPKPAAKPAAKSGDDASLLSAMRNVRKQMDERRRDDQ
jgi:hypothetical protein